MGERANKGRFEVKFKDAVMLLLVSLVSGAAHAKESSRLGSVRIRRRTSLGGYFA